MTHFDISIVSDTVCPWCYIGLRNLQVAIAQRSGKSPKDTLTITWHPFQLNPNSPRGQTVDKRTSYENKLGKDGARNVFDRLRTAGKAAGINFSFNGRIGNTLDSHRLLELAHRQSGTTDASPAPGQVLDYGMQTRLAEELFADFFEREQDITDHVTLSKAAVRAGLTNQEDEIVSWLASDDLVEVVQQEAAAQRTEGINGVPHFAINEEFAVEGAQEPIAFLHLFDRLARRSKAVL
jgi:predicted DsbA family dithiol-disulfide isomerase